MNLFVKDLNEINFIAKADTITELSKEMDKWFKKNNYKTYCIRYWYEEKEGFTYIDYGASRYLLVDADIIPLFKDDSDASGSN